MESMAAESAWREGGKMTSKESDSWYTPDTTEQPVLSLVKASLGGAIGLDCTADPDKQVPALRHFTEQDNCLIQQCNDGETIFCNPPYSSPKPFVQWVADQVASGRCPAAVMLCKSGVMSNQGTGAIIEQHASAACYWRYNGRINFIPGNGVIARFEQEYLAGKRKSPSPTTADFDTVVVYFGRNWRWFAATWKDYGTIALLPNACKKIAMTHASLDLLHSANLHQQQALAKCQIERLQAELQHWQYLASDYQQKLSQLTDSPSIIDLKYCITQTQKQISNCEYWITQWERHGRNTD